MVKRTRLAVRAREDFQSRAKQFLGQAEVVLLLGLGRANKGSLMYAMLFLFAYCL